MRKRPDYGNATPGDLARSLMHGHRKTARYRQSGPGKSDASRPDSELPGASDPGCQTGGDCASPKTLGHSDQDALG